MKRRGLFFFGLTIVLVVLGVTLKRWLPYLLQIIGLIGQKTDLLQGIEAVAQLALILFGGIAFIYGWILRKRHPQPGEAQPKVVIVSDKRDLDENFFRQVMGQSHPAEELRRATQRYLEYLVDRYCYLEFKGMGIADRVPLRLELRDLYVPLKARIELPAGETWTRDWLLAGRKMPEHERENFAERLSESKPLFDLLQQHDGLIILGDPGAGKTTFLKYLTLQLATGGNAETRLPILVPLSAYANALAARDIRLDDFIAGYFHDIGLDLPTGDMLRQALKQGRAVVMLDGLDEVKELNRRETVVRAVIDFFLFHRQAGNKFLLTSRIIGYREVRPTAQGLAECTLVDFDDGEIETFVRRWTQAIEKAARGDTAMAAQEAERERDELLTAVRHNPGVRQLAANPLLLTILALMKRQGIRLPERRVELYQKYVETLLSSWNRARGLGRPPARDLDVVETIKILAPLALWMHEVNPGVGLVKQGALMRRLEEIYHERGEADPERSARQFLSDVRENTGLLLERGAGQFGFIHLTFEEYLAAVALAQRGQQSISPIGEALTAHLGDDNWHEVSLLTIGYLGIVQQRDEAAGAVLHDLIQRSPGQPGQAIVLAGKAVADAWPGGVTAACKTEIEQALQQTMMNSAQVQPVLRALAGNTLAQLGDPRREVMTTEDMQFCLVPAGPFWMGDKKELHRNECLNYDYWMSRHPVTNAQFNEFVQAGGYKIERYWPEAKAAEYWHDGQVKNWEGEKTRTQPEDYGSPFNLPNHPVVGVTWYEMLAFTRWLTEMGREKKWLDEKMQIDLPSEAEWEKAARGGEEIFRSPCIISIDKIMAEHYTIEPRMKNEKPQRRYPWSDDADPNRANYDETKIGATNAVGCFPDGMSPYGCEEMSGNVWEWTRSLWGNKYPYDPKDGRENLEAPTNVGRVIRGGSFSANASAVRCAYRNWRYPLYRDWGRGFRLVARPLSF
jgi:formylglycine-generating enzyme required for sulfatase activity